MATISITTTAGEDTRIATAFGTKLNLGRNATGPEVKADIVAYIKEVVIGQERQIYLAGQPSNPISPT